MNRKYFDEALPLAKLCPEGASNCLLNVFFPVNGTDWDPIHPDLILTMGSSPSWESANVEDEQKSV